MGICGHKNVDNFTRLNYYVLQSEYFWLIYSKITTPMSSEKQTNNLLQIGTPLTSSSIKVMMLGAGELGKEVVIEFQRYGVEVIAVDRYPNAPAMHVAHRSYSISMLNGVALREVIEKERQRSCEIIVTIPVSFASLVHPPLR